MFVGMLYVRIDSAETDATGSAEVGKRLELEAVWHLSVSSDDLGILLRVTDDH